MSDIPYFRDAAFLPSSQPEFTLSIQEGFSFDEKFGASSPAESSTNGSTAPTSRCSQNSRSTHRSVSVAPGAIPLSDASSSNLLDTETFPSSIVDSTVRNLFPGETEKGVSTSIASDNSCFLDPYVAADETPSSFSSRKYLSFSPLLPFNYPAYQGCFGSPGVPPPPPTAIPFPPSHGSGPPLNLVPPSENSLQNINSAPNNNYHQLPLLNGPSNTSCRDLPVGSTNPSSSPRSVSPSFPLADVCSLLSDGSSSLMSSLWSPNMTPLDSGDNNTSCPSGRMRTRALSPELASPVMPLTPLLSPDYDLPNLLYTSKRWQNLNIVLPVTVPSGTIVVTKRQSGENTFVFPDTMRGAQLLFSSAGRVCDSWATNLRLRVAVIHKCPDFLVPKVVEVFNRHLANIPKFSEPIKLRCTGLVKHTIRLRSTNGLTYRYDTIGQLQRPEDHQKMQHLFDHLKNVLWEVNRRLVTEAQNVFAAIHAYQAASPSNASHCLPGSEIYDAATGKCGLEFRFSPCKEFKIAVREGTPCECVGVDNLVTGGSSMSTWAQQFSVDEVIINEVRIERDKTVETQIDPAFAPEYSLKTRAISRDVDGTPARVYLLSPRNNRENYIPHVDTTVYNNALDAAREIYNANHTRLAALLPAGMRSLLAPVPPAMEAAASLANQCHRPHSNLPVLAQQPQSSHRRQLMSPIAKQQHPSAISPPQSYGSAHERPQSAALVAASVGAAGATNQDTNCLSATARASFHSGLSTTFSSPRQLTVSPSWPFNNPSNRRPHTALPYHPSLADGRGGSGVIPRFEENPKQRRPPIGGNGDGAEVRTAAHAIQHSMPPNGQRVHTLDLDASSKSTDNHASTNTSSLSNVRSKEGEDTPADLSQDVLKGLVALQKMLALLGPNDTAKNNPNLLGANDTAKNNPNPMWSPGSRPSDEIEPPTETRDPWKCHLMEEPGWTPHVENPSDVGGEGDGMISALARLQTALGRSSYDASPLFSSLSSPPLTTANGMDKSPFGAISERTTSAGATTKGDDIFEASRYAESGQANLSEART